MKWAPINNKSYYFFLESCLSVDDIVNFSINNNIKYASLIDNNMFGTMEFYLKCKSNNLIPIIGLENVYNNKKIIFIAKNYNGYKLLLKLSSKIMNSEEVIKNNLNDLIILYDEFIENSDWYDIQDNIFYECYSKDKESTILKFVLNAIKNYEKIYDKLIDFNTTNSYLDFINSFINENNKKTINGIINKININLEYENNFIKIDIKDKENKFYELVINKLTKKTNNFNNINKQEYLDRINKEFSLIKQKGFIDYFLVVYYLIKFCNQNNIIIGPGRGSAASSLISYSLGITKIDPIKYNLVFERFLTSERNTMPDIDLDIMDTKREEVIEYLISKYSNEKVCQIITFTKIKSKMAIRDIARVLNIDLSVVNKICKLIRDDLNLIDNINNNEELKKYEENYSKLFYFAKKIIDFPRQHSLHAAGVLLSKKPIYEIIPVLEENNRFVSQFSMEYLENNGLFKIDLLSLRNLTIIDDTLRLIQKKYNKQIDIYKLDVNNQNIFNYLSKGNTFGIFQLESVGMTKLIKRIKPTCLEDISVCSALFRPGAQKFIDKYIESKNSKQISYINNRLQEILKPTYGSIIYQEQIIKIVQEVAKLNGSESEAFRKAISKKHKEEIFRLKKIFIDNGLKNNFSLKELEQIFNFMLDFASYGFNHAHSISYAYISYIMTYLKYYFPIEFNTSILNKEFNVDKLNIIIKELKERKVFIKNPCFINSSSEIIGINNNIYLNFKTIKSFNNKVLETFLKLRQDCLNNNFSLARILIVLTNGLYKETVVELIKVGCFDYYHNNREQLLEWLDNIIIEFELFWNDDYWNSFFSKNKVNKINYELYETWEKEILDFSLTSVYKEFDENKTFITTITINDIKTRLSKSNETIKIIVSKINNKEFNFYIFDKLLLNKDLKINSTIKIEYKNFLNSNKNNFILKKIF